MSEEQLDYFIGFFGALAVYLILMTTIYWIFSHQYPIYTDKEIQEWDKEDMGNIPDAFHLSQSEIDELRKSKKEIASYAREKLKELMEQEQLRLSEDDLGDLLWLVINYGDKLEKYPGENQVENLTTKLEKMLDGMG
jgi:hypothetical protein